jgi:hypothetical protein
MSADFVATLLTPISRAGQAFSTFRPDLVAIAPGRVGFDNGKAIHKLHPNFIENSLAAALKCGSVWLAVVLHENTATMGGGR